jgi:uncharacterized phage-associated protein
MSHELYISESSTRTVAGHHWYRTVNGTENETMIRQQSRNRRHSAGQLTPITNELEPWQKGVN